MFPAHVCVLALCEHRVLCAGLFFVQPNAEWYERTKGIFGHVPIMAGVPLFRCRIKTPSFIF